MPRHSYEPPAPASDLDRPGGAIIIIIGADMSVGCLGSGAMRLTSPSVAGALADDDSYTGPVILARVEENSAAARIELAPQKPGELT